MDNMYSTIQQACKQAIRAHNNEKRVHVVFFEMGLYRIKPVDEIEEIDEQKVYGWTVAKWMPALHPEMVSSEYRRLFPMGDDAFIRKQFYRGEGRFSPTMAGLKVYNEYTHDEIRKCLVCGQRF
jgi:hypothetical protein